MNRRHLLTTLASAAVATASGQTSSSPARIARKGRIKQSFFTRSLAGSKLSNEEMFQVGQRLGAAGFDMVPPAQWPALKKYGLMCCIGSGGGVSIENGIIHKEMHDSMAQSLEAFIDQCAANGVPSILIAGGQKKGLSIAEGTANALAFLNRMKGHAEEKGVNLCVEVMNDKYTNPAIGRVDQIGNHLGWVADVVSKVNSPRVKILFDIYHVQIMDGNVVENIKSVFPLIGHFHTAGVPGRHEMDENQELNYSFIFRSIADLGYTGYVAHEYDPSPGKDPVALLEKVAALADV
ncbi:MAG TPA: TIM barrel protein [Bryobacteraceae bacterium]|nr:TIM barrel protein [Bryobacteraceae bacterium]